MKSLKENYEWRRSLKPGDEVAVHWGPEVKIEKVLDIKEDRIYLDTLTCGPSQCGARRMVYFDVETGVGVTDQTCVILPVTPYDIHNSVTHDILCTIQHRLGYMNKEQADQIHQAIKNVAETWKGGAE